ncbi:galactosylceramide sulfotransferase-like [Saccostrea cucullata]|uniref:galactosylceramide sulfotransferase-like n=1 Tax=Saccostrea cuccullata TaxID=36930 RepID=UPI002ED0328A
MVSTRFVVRKVIPVVFFLICVIVLTRRLPLDIREDTPPDSEDVIEDSVPDFETLHRPDERVGYWNKFVADVKYQGERDNFVFIKCMKCATQTVAGALRRYAFTRRLNVVLPRDNNIYLGWPYLMDEVDYRPSEEKFNCLIEHAIYNRTIMEPLFPRNTPFITIIREPWSHFKSTFHYFKVDKIAGIEAEDPIEEYLNNIQKYEAIYKSRESRPYRYCVPDGFSVTKNLLSHCLGMPLGFPPGRVDYSQNEVLANEYIKKLDREFGLVMIMEYFDESMIFLKRLMSWSFKEIVYKKSNVGNYAKDAYPQYLKNIHREWSSVDYLLYDHFREKMELKIQSAGFGFQSELKQFRQVLSELNRFCASARRSSRINAKISFKHFTFTGYECAFLGEEVNHLELLQKRNNAELTEKLKSYKRTC